MIIILSGFSGVGKDTILNDIKNLYKFKEIISYTSRPIRKKEINGKEYHFISKENFKNKIKNNEFLEHRKYITNIDTWYYGIHKSSIKDGNYISVLDLKGLKAIRNKFKVISIFIDAPIEIRRERAISRGSFCQEEFNRRLKDDLELYPKDIIENEFDYVVENIDYKKCIKEIKGILDGL